MTELSTLACGYRTMTARELAEACGVSHAAMRQRPSRAFVPSPRRDAVRSRRSLLTRLWWRGTVEEIAQYMGVPSYTVRRDARRMGLHPITNQHPQR